MPVKSMPIFNMGQMDDLNCVLDADPLHPNTSEPLLSDDIWKKFQLDLPTDLTIFDDIFVELDDSANFDWREVCEIRNHDCMWAGHCGSKEHPADEPRLHNCIVPAPPGPIKAPAPFVTAQIKPPPPVQQSLLKPALRAAAAASMPPPSAVHTPQTPPMSDDEESKAKPTEVLEILNDAISAMSECDSDLCDYFEGGDEIADPADIKEEVEEEDEEEEEEEILEDDEFEEEEDDEDVKPDLRSLQFAAVNDHSYHKDKNASMSIANSLGIVTPSDSEEEEEIDVVSVGEKHNISRMVCSLPTNPSSRDRHQLQKRMETAITKKQQRVRTNIKTILPIVRADQSPLKRRMAGDSRGVKRSRQYRVQPSNTSPYKRRAAYGNSSDSEPEPSEKRSLHNNMERQRRIDLRNAFEDLRVLVPEVSKKDRAPKVVILREAAQYCDHLGNVSFNYTAQANELKKKQEWLRQRVSQLRRTLAAKR